MIRVVLLLTMLALATLTLADSKPSSIAVPPDTASKLKDKFQAALTAQAQFETARANFEARASEWREALISTRYELSVPKDWNFDSDKMQFLPPPTPPAPPTQAPVAPKSNVPTDKPRQ